MYAHTLTDVLPSTKKCVNTHIHEYTSKVRHHKQHITIWLKDKHLCCHIFSLPLNWLVQLYVCAHTQTFTCIHMCTLLVFLMRVFILQIVPLGEIIANVGPWWLVQVFSGRLSLWAMAGHEHTLHLPHCCINCCSAAADTHMRWRHGHNMHKHTM